MQRLTVTVPPAAAEGARWLFCQVLFALDYCHRMGVPARSISMDNIWVLNNNPQCLVAQ